MNPPETIPIAQHDADDNDNNDQDIQSNVSAKDPLKDGNKINDKKADNKNIKGQGKDNKATGKVQQSTNHQDDQEPAYDMNEELKQLEEIQKNKQMMNQYQISDTEMQGKLGVVEHLQIITNKFKKQQENEQWGKSKNDGLFYFNSLFDASSFEILKIFLKRKLTRILIHAGILFILILAYILYIVIMNKSETFNIAATENPINLQMHVSNCFLTLTEFDKNENNDAVIMKVQYLSKNGGEQLQGKNYVQFQKINDTNYEIWALSAFKEPKECQISMQMSSDFMKIGFDQFRFECVSDQKCFFTQQQGTLKANNIYFYNLGLLGQLGANFKEIEVANGFNFEVPNTEGSLLLQNIIMKGIQTYNYIHVSFGEVVVQTTQEVQIGWVSKQNSFCFMAPYVIESSRASWNCDISGENVFKNNGVDICSGQINLCLSAQCTSQHIFMIQLDNGAIYTNLLNEKYKQSSVLDQRIIKSKNFDKGIDLEPIFRNSLSQILSKATTGKNEDAIYIVDIGNKFHQSTDTTTWVITKNPAYSLVKPYTLSIFSVTMLTTNLEKYQGYLSPGFCPYHPKLSRPEMLNLQEFLDMFFVPTSNNSVTSYVLPNQRAQYKDIYDEGDGIELFQGGQEWENWYQTGRIKDQLFTQELSISNNKILQLTIALGFIIPIIIGFLFVFIIHYGLKKLNAYMLTSCYHQQQYFKIYHEEEKQELIIRKSLLLEQKINNSNDADNEDDDDYKNQKGGEDSQQQIGQSSAAENLAKKSIPMVMQMIDFYAFTLSRKFLISSGQAFYKQLFRPCSEIEKKKLQNGEMNQSFYLEFQERELKNYYEKYCFVNMYPEEDISSESMTKFLKKQFGYCFTQDPEHSQLLTKITEKKNFVIPTQQEILRVDQNILFINCCYEVTGIDSDQEWVSSIQEKYIQFCKTSRIEFKDLKLSQIVNEFGLKIIYKNSKKLARIDETENREQAKSQVFLIDKNQMNMHFDLILDVTNFVKKNLQEIDDTGLKESDTKVVLRKTVYYDGWWMSDFSIVVAFIVFEIILIAIPIYVIMLVQLSVTDYTVKNPFNQATYYDLDVQGLGVFNYFSDMNQGLQAVAILCYIYFALVNADKIYRYKEAKFPENNSFIYANEQSKQPIWRLYYWIHLIVFYILCFMWIFYIFLVMIWLIIGAIINPDKFLVYASGVVTIITVAVTKSTSVMNIIDSGKKVISETSDEVFFSTTKEITEDIIKEVQFKATIIPKKQQEDNVKITGMETIALRREINKFQAKVDQFFKDPEKAIEAQSEVQLSIQGGEGGPGSGMSGGNGGEVSDKDVQLYLEYLKQDFFRVACKQIDDKSRELNLPSKLNEIFKQVIFASPEDAQQALISVFANKENVFNEKIIKWIINITNEKRLKELKYSTHDTRLEQNLIKEDLVDALLDLIFFQLLGDKTGQKETKNNQQSQALLNTSQAAQSISQQIIQNSAKILNRDKSDEQIKLEKMKLVFLKMLNLIQLQEDDNKPTIMKILIDVILLLQNDNSFVQQKESIFMIKNLSILYQMMSGTINSLTLRQQSLGAFEVLKIPDKLGMMLSIILSPPLVNSWEYGNLKILRDDHLWDFVKEFVREIKYANHDQSATFTFFFKTMFNFMRGKNVNFGELAKIQKKINKANKIEKEIDSNFYQFLTNTCNIAQIAFNSGENFHQDVTQLAADTGINEELINEFILLSTNNYYKIFSNERIQSLRNSQLLNSMAQDMRIGHQSLLGLAALFHNDTSIEGKRYIEKFMTEIFDILNIIDDTQKQILSWFIQLATTNTPFEAEKIFQQIAQSKDPQIHIILRRLKKCVKEETFKKKRKRAINEFKKENNKEKFPDIKPMDDQTICELIQFLNLPFFELREEFFLNNPVKRLINYKLQYGLCKYFNGPQDKVKEIEVILKQQSGLLKLAIAKLSQKGNQIYPGQDDEFNVQSQATQKYDINSFFSIFPNSIGDKKAQNEINIEMADNNKSDAQFLQQNYQEYDEFDQILQENEEINNEDPQLINIQKHKTNDFLQRLIYKNDLRQISKKTPIFMIKSLYNELLKIFVASSTGFKRESETRFVINNLVNFLRLKYIDKLETGEHFKEVQSRREFQIKQTCNFMSQMMNIPAQALIHLYSMFSINPNTYQALLYFVNNKKNYLFKENNTQNFTLKTQEIILQNSLKQITEYVYIKDKNINLNQLLSLKEYVPNYMVKYESLLQQFIYPIDSVIPDDHLSCFVAEFIQKLDTKQQEEKQPNQLVLNYPMIKQIIYSLIYFKNIKYVDFINILDPPDPNLKLSKKQKLKKKQQLQLVDTLIKSLTSRQIFNVVYVICEKVSQNNYIYLATMMWALMQKKNISQNSKNEDQDNDQEDNADDDSNTANPTNAAMITSNQDDSLFGKIKDKKLNKFLIYFPLFKYYFTNKAESFSDFASYILKQSFGFQAISSDYVKILFSLFTKNTRLDSLSNLLKINLYYIEVSKMLADLQFQQAKLPIISQFLKSTSVEIFLNKLKFSKAEFSVLIKIFSNCLNVEDLEDLFKSFMLSDQFDTGFIKGVFNLIQNKINYDENVKNEDEENQFDLKQMYQHQYEFRRQAFEKLSAIQSEQQLSLDFEALETVYNLYNGNFQYLIFQQQQSKLIRQANFFGGQQTQANILLSIIGFLKCDIDIKNYDYWSETIEDEFEQIEIQKRKQNIWLQSFHNIRNIVRINPEIMLKLLAKSVQTDLLKQNSNTEIQLNEDNVVLNEKDQYFQKEKLEGDDDQDIQKNKNTANQKYSILEKFDCLSLTVKYRLLEYEFIKNFTEEIKNKNQIAEKKDKQQQAEGTYMDAGRFKSFSEEKAKPSQPDLQQNNDIIINEQKQQNADQAVKGISTYSLKQLYDLFIINNSELGLSIYEQRYTIFYLIFYTSLKNMRIIMQKQELDIEEQQFEDYEHKKYKQQRNEKKQYYMLKLFNQLDLLLTAIERWGKIKHPAQFNTYYKNLIEQLFIFGLFPGNFFSDSLQNKQQQQQKQMQQKVGSNQKKLQWNLRYIYPTSLDAVNKAGDEFDNNILKKNIACYQILEDILTKYENKNSKILLIGSNDKEEEKKSLNETNRGPAMIVDNVIQEIQEEEKAFKQIFATIEECMSLFNVTDKKIQEKEDNQDKEFPRRQNLFESMQLMQKQFYYLIQKNPRKIENALIWMNSRRPGILGNANNMMLIRHLLCSIVIKNKNENFKECNQIIHLLSKKMKSDIYNMKLLLKVQISDKATPEDLYDFIHIIMSGKRYIFDAIMLIYGKLMLDQSGGGKNKSYIKVNDIFNYYSFHIDAQEYQEGLQEASETILQIYKKTKSREFKFIDMEQDIPFSRVDNFKTEKNKENYKFDKKKEAALKQKIQVINMTAMGQAICRSEYILYCLRQLLNSMGVTEKQMKYIQTLILCLCGEPQAWMDLFDQKLNITRGSSLLRPLLYQFMQKIHEKRLPRNISDAHLASQSIFDILCSQNNSINIKNLLLFFFAQEFTNQEYKADIVQNKFKELQSYFQVIIQIFVSISQNRLILTTEDFQTTALFLTKELLPPPPKPINGVQPPITDPKTLPLTIICENLLAISLYHYFNPNINAVNEQIEYHVLQFNNLLLRHPKIIIDQEQEQKIENEIKELRKKKKNLSMVSSMVYNKNNLTPDQQIIMSEILGMVGCLLSKNQISIFKHLLVLDKYQNQSDVKQIVNLISLWAISKSKYCVQLDSSVSQSISKQLMQLYSVPIFQEINAFKNKNQQQKNNDIPSVAQFRQKIVDQITNLQQDLNDEKGKSECLRNIAYQLKLKSESSLALRNCTLSHQTAAWLFQESFNSIQQDNSVSGTVQDGEVQNTLGEIVTQAGQFFEILDQFGLQKGADDHLNGLRGVLLGFIRFLLKFSNTFDVTLLDKLKEYVQMNGQVLGSLGGKITEAAKLIQDTKFETFSNTVSQLWTWIQANEQQVVQQEKEKSQINLNVVLELMMPVLFLGYKLLRTRKSLDEQMDTFQDPQVKHIIIEFCNKLRELYLTNKNEKIQATKESITQLFSLITETIQEEQKVDNGEKKKETNPAILNIIKSFLQYFGYPANLIEQMKYYLEFVQEMNVKIDKLFLNLFVSGDDLKKIQNDFVEVITDFFNQKDNKEFENIRQVYPKKIIDSIVSLSNHDFSNLNDEFFILFQVSQQDAQRMKTFLNEFTVQVTQSLNYVGSQYDSYKLSKIKKSSLSKLHQVQDKLINEIPLTYEDLFVLIDVENTGRVSLREFKILLKRLGINLSDHRVLEIFAYVKDTNSQSFLQNCNVQDQVLIKNEFVQSMKYVKLLTMNNSLQALGIDSEMLLYGLLYTMTLIILLILFIFAAVSVFTLAGTFGSVVNSSYPMVGGGFISNSRKNVDDFFKNKDEIVKKIKESMEKLQSNSV